MSLTCYVNVYVMDGTVLPEAATRDFESLASAVRQFVRLRGGVWPNRLNSWVLAAEPLLVRVFGFAAVRNETRENR